jgi:hypothetical protein
MKTPRQLPPKPRFADPRNAGDFCARYYPKLSGEPAPTVRCRDRSARIKREFLAAYYALNRAWASLRQVRKLKSSAARTQRERLPMLKIERALRRRDALEDYYAPFGIAVEAVLRHGFAVELKFTAGATAPPGRTPTNAIEVFSAEVPIPIPSGFAWVPLARGVRRALTARW